MAFGAEYTLHIIHSTRPLPTAPDTRDELGQLYEIPEAEVGIPLRQHHERVRRSQVRPRTRNRGYRAVGAFVPNPITMAAGPLGDSHELLAQQRMEGVGDENPRRRRWGIRCS